MNKLQLILVDSDKEFVSMVTDYIQTSEYALKYVIKSFTQKSSLETYLTLSKEDHILLINRNLLGIDLELNNVTCVILLSEIVPTTEHEMYQLVYKYQPLNLLFSQVMGVYLEKFSDLSFIQSGKNQKTQVISIYSASGRSGKTVVALNLAQQLVLQEKKVLLISLETISSLSVLLKLESGQQFSQILYYLRSDVSKLASKLQSLKSYHAELGIEYINPILNIREMNEISKSDIQSLIEALTTTEEYDFILIDLESSMHARVIGSMESSDRIFWIVQDDIQSLHKTQVMFTEYIALSETNERRRDASIFILNREIGAMINRFNVEGASIQESLPYVPQWKSVSSGEQLLSSLEFKQSVQKLFRFFTTIDGVEAASE
jgi:cellulose biosynthesis protein BcsQ